MLRNKNITSISDDKKLRILSIEDITEKLIMEKKLHQEK